MSSKKRNEILTPTRAMTERSILQFIGRHRPTFGELVKGTGFSKGTVSPYVKRLEREGVVRRDFRGRQVIYILTREAERSRQIQNDAFRDWLLAIRSLIVDPELAKAVYELSKAAKKDPELVEEFLMDMGKVVVLLQVFACILPTVKKLTSAEWSNVKDKVMEETDIPATLPSDTNSLGKLDPLDRLLQSMRRTVKESLPGVPKIAVRRRSK